MEFFNPFTLINLLVGLTFIIAGFIQLKYPPKKINAIYGYRTKSSMKNQERWDFAQRFSAREMINIGGSLSIIAGVGFFIKINEIIGVGIGMGLLFLIMFFLFKRTEQAIGRKFGPL